MKYIKLLLIFAVVAGGLYLALNWKNIIENVNQQNFPQEDKIDVNARLKKMEGHWQEATAFSDSLFIEWFNEIEQLKGGKLITEKSDSLLHNTLFEDAANKLSDSYKASLLNENYSDGKVKAFRNGVDTIAKYERIKKLENQPRLAHIVESYDFYSSVLKFVNSSHAISPYFDTKNKTWTSFDSKMQAIKNQAESFKSNALFDEMNTIQQFISGLDESHLESVMEPYRDNFYKELSNKIIGCFNYTVNGSDINPADMNQMRLVVGGSEVVVYQNKLNDETQRLLGGIWSRFDDENRNRTYTSNLSNFKDRYNNALTAKKEAIAAMKEND